MEVNMGKGSSPRPFKVSNEEYSSRWDAIFGKDKKESDKIEATATFSGGKGDSSPPCCYPSVMTNTDDEVVNVDSRTSK
jgi:hypothetical protein